MSERVGNLDAWFTLQRRVPIKLVRYTEETCSVDNLSSSSDSFSASPGSSPARRRRRRAASSDPPILKAIADNDVMAYTCYIETEHTYGTSGDALCASKADALHAAANDLLAILTRFDGDHEAVAAIRPLRRSLPVAYPAPKQRRRRTMMSVLRGFSSRSGKK